MVTARSENFGHSPGSAVSNYVWSNPEPYMDTTWWTYLRHRRAVLTTRFTEKRLLSMYCVCQSTAASLSFSTMQCMGACAWLHASVNIMKYQRWKLDLTPVEEWCGHSQWHQTSHASDVQWCPAAKEMMRRLAPFADWSFKWGFPEIGVPPNGLFIMKNPII